jgi:hypothetical protein
MSSNDDATLQQRPDWSEDARLWGESGSPYARLDRMLRGAGFAGCHPDTTDEAFLALEIPLLGNDRLLAAVLDLRPTRSRLPVDFLLLRGVPTERP